MRSITSNRGSVLIVALILAAILAISLTSYLKLALNAGNLANRSFHFNAAHNLVDTGFEHAIWALNDARLHPAPANWTNGGFTQISATEYRGTFPSASGTFTSASPSYPLSGGATGRVKVWATVSNLAAIPAPTPAQYIWHTVVEATITLGDGSKLKKFAECYLQQQSWSEKGMVARERIEFTGNGGASVDSWISRPPPTYAHEPYTTSNRRCNATIAAIDFIAVQNGDIFGNASVGTSSIATGMSWQQNNGVLNGTNPPTAPNFDQTRVKLNFTSSFPDVDDVPAISTPLGAITSSNPTLTTGTYDTPSIALAGSNTIAIGSSTVNADVVLIVNGNINMTGQSSIIIHPGSSLKIYISGNFDMSGNLVSIVNNLASGLPANPDRCIVLGTRTERQVSSPPWGGGMSMQVLDFAGTAGLSAVVYAPNGNIRMHGGGAMYGSMVGNRVEMNGGGAFHQDESLSNLRVSGRWGLMKWRELSTAAERANYATQLNF
jgi:hypothetical protein